TGAGEGKAPAVSAPTERGAAGALTLRSVVGRVDRVAGTLEFGDDVLAVLRASRLQFQRHLHLANAESPGDAGVRDVDDVRAEFTQPRDDTRERTGPVGHPQPHVQVARRRGHAVLD